MAIAASVLSCVTGCGLGPLSVHAKAFSAATIPLVDNSEDAYRGAIKLRSEEQADAAVYAYDEKPNWSPIDDPKPLLTGDQLNARIVVLEALKVYATTLVELTGGPSKDLENAASGAGTNLKGLSNSVETSFGHAIVNPPQMSGTEANGVSTALRALGSYLQGRKLRHSLPKVTTEMDPYVRTLCDLVQSDIKILRRQADVDYTNLLTAENTFIQHEGDKLDPIERRTEIAKLLDLANQQKANDALLKSLSQAVEALALTHHALAAAAQGNNPENFRQKIGDLVAAGQQLANYYQSLPTT